MNPSSPPLPPTPPPSFLGGRLLAEGDSFKFCLGKQQINLLQHMLGSLISSREIRLRGRGTRRAGRKNTATMKDEDDGDVGFSLCSDDWWRRCVCGEVLFRQSPPPLPPFSSSCEKKSWVNEGSAANCFGPWQIMTSTLNS